MDINILGIESSCDETACSVVRNGREILSSVIASSADIFEKYGGVVPEIASRKHIEYIIPVIEEAIEKADCEIHGIAVTKGPGLVGALLVGISAAKALAYTMNVPLIGVNHLKGHIAANYITHKELEPPFICLLVSGGHSHVLHVKDYNDIEILGRTRDDAAGEAFDKVARSLGLGYPGGVKVDRCAKAGNPHAIEFPRTKFKDNPYDFSFSGLKTSVLNYINIQKQKKIEINNADVCASFQNAVTDVLLRNTLNAAKEKNINKIALAGGVSANSYLRARITEESKKKNISVFLPELILCTDNAAMIAAYGYHQYIAKDFAEFDLNADSSLRI